MLDGGFELACPPNNHEFFFAAISVSNNLTEKAGLFLFFEIDPRSDLALELDVSAQLFGCLDT